MQLALLTQRIEGLRGHFQKHKKDFHSNRGLLKMIGLRKRLLRYLRRTDEKNYMTVIKKLGLRK